MSLHLDPRQRAMLQEMGVRLWWPGAVAHTTEAAPPVRAAPLPTAPTAAPARPPAPPPLPAPPAVRPAAAAPAPAPARGLTPPLRVLHPPRALFPDADPQHSPATLGAGWLLVAEGTADADPLAGDAGRLLGNMLHALQLHRHPRVFLCTLSAPLGPDTDAAPAADVLAQALARVQPSVLLLMGRAAAQAVLGRNDPLGPLRAQTHTVAGVPAVVTYDAPYLLRAPDAKAAAWADLCQARALARSTPAAP
ncbi:MAG: uracil-DNA glycosylase family protein [Giesbergeria sp.]|nr:uracil-DNA glycosylase family protein [Giesbergeria sp.]